LCVWDHGIMCYLKCTGSYGHVPTSSQRAMLPTRVQIRDGHSTSLSICAEGGPMPSWPHWPASIKASLNDPALSSHQAPILPRRVHFRHCNSASPPLEEYLHDPFVPHLPIVRLTPHAHIDLGFVWDAQRSLQRVSISLNCFGHTKVVLPSAERRSGTS